MTRSTGGTYEQELLLALRLRDVPSGRIAEVLAEVDSHVAETGEDPAEAFGPAKAYAREFSGDVGEPAGRSRRTVRGVVATLGCGAGGWLLANGVHALGAGTAATFGWPAWLGVLLGAGLLVLGGLDVRRQVRSQGGVRITDPRSGDDMRPALPVWVLVVLVGIPAVSLVAAFVLGAISRG